MAESSSADARQPYKNLPSHKVKLGSRSDSPTTLFLKHCSIQIRDLAAVPAYASGIINRRHFTFEVACPRQSYLSIPYIIILSNLTFHQETSVYRKTCCHQASRTWAYPRRQSATYTQNKVLLSSILWPSNIPTFQQPPPPCNVASLAISQKYIGVRCEDLPNLRIRVFGRRRSERGKP